MTLVDWKRVWRSWVRARFGGRLRGHRLDEAVQGAEAFRAMAGRVTAVPLDNGEAPFPNSLPTGSDGGAG